MTTATKKVTRATIKSFIRKNREALLIKTTSRFDGMTDGCEQTGEKEFTPALPSDKPWGEKNDLGVHGAWFVGQSRDWFSHYSDDEVEGYEISNCCGRFYLAIPKTF